MGFGRTFLVFKEYQCKKEQGMLSFGKDLYLIKQERSFNAT